MTCGRALRQLFEKLGDEILSAAEVYRRLQEAVPNNSWSDVDVAKRLRKYSVNDRYLKPRLQERSFLFRVGSDQFRNWNPTIDGYWSLVDGEMQMQQAADPDDDAIGDDGELEMATNPVAITLERDLENFLAQNVAIIERGLKLFRSNGTTGRQFNTEVVGIIDLLATDEAGNFVVIELKAGEAHDKACAQLLRYIGWVEISMAGGKSVRGILVASDFTQNCRYAAKAAGRIQLRKYEVEFKFTSIPLPAPDALTRTA